MAKRKLRNFAELLTFPNVVQHVYEEEKYDHPFKGNWKNNFFKNNKPITVEFGCGKGEYTVALAEKHPERNFIGVDIKGNRMWRGAKTAIELGLNNVAFLRTQINDIEHVFGKNELSEVWVTFPDPKPKPGDARKRLTSSENCKKYKEMMGEVAIVNLKTDSDFIFNFTKDVIQQNNFKVLRMSDDIDIDFPGDELLQVRTYYEMKFRKQGIPIHYLRFEV
jgi:tRNA (guanine-N7-)-methyltransferase